MALDVVEISAIVGATVAAVGVLIGVIYYILDVRNQSKVRQTELVMGLTTFSLEREWREAARDTINAEFEDYDDFVKKYGAFLSKNPVPMAFHLILDFYEQVGVLFQRKLIEPYLVYQFFPIERNWMKVKPLVEGIRKELNDPRVYEWFEYLYSEMMKRKQKLPQ